jgi:hypothetical protein
MTVAQRTVDSDTWTVQRLDSVIGWDSHNYVTMAVDEAGHLQSCRWSTSGPRGRATSRR